MGRLDLPDPIRDEDIFPTTAARVEFKRVASGDYETEDGRFRLYRLVGVNPPAWNIEDDLYAIHVDGAATKRDALRIFEEGRR
jgi:hypothetical protein